MKFPICIKCLKGKILCKNCKNNFYIVDDEVKLYKKIYSILKGETHLTDVEIKRVFHDDKMIVIVCKKEDVGKVIGKNGIIAKKMEKKFKKDVKIVPDDVENFARDVLSPSHINGINIVYEGEKEVFKVRMPKIEKEMMRTDREFFKRIFYDFFKKEIDFEFE